MPKQSLHLSTEALEAYKMNLFCALELPLDTSMKIGQEFEVDIGGEFGKSLARIVSMQNSGKLSCKLAVLQLYEFVIPD